MDMIKDATALANLMVYTSNKHGSNIDMYVMSVLITQYNFRPLPIDISMLVGDYIDDIVEWCENGSKWPFPTKHLSIENLNAVTDKADNGSDTFWDRISLIDDGHNPQRYFLQINIDYIMLVSYRKDGPNTLVGIITDYLNKIRILNKHS